MRCHRRSVSTSSVTRHAFERLVTRRGLGTSRAPFRDIPLLTSSSQFTRSTAQAPWTPRYPTGVRLTASKSEKPSVLCELDRAKGLGLGLGLGLGRGTSTSGWQGACTSRHKIARGHKIAPQASACAWEASEEPGVLRPPHCTPLRPDTPIPHDHHDRPASGPAFACRSQVQLQS